MSIEIKKLAGEVTPWTWSEWHNECLKRFTLEFKKSTVKGYDGAVKKVLTDEWNQRKLVDFSKTHVHDFIFEEMQDATPHVKKNTLKRIHRIFQMALEEGLIGRNPATGIRVKLPAPNQLVLNSTEAEILLREAHDVSHRFYEVWTFALMTGMRSGEMYAVRWSDIDFDTDLINVKRQWTSKDGLHPTKSNRNRVVPVSEDLKKFLVEWKLESGGGFRETLWDGVNRQDITHPDYVLPRLSEWKVGSQAEVLRDFCHGIGITEVKFHDLRATFITNLLSQGISLVKVMSIVGHSKMATTDKYLRLAGVSINGATNKLGYTVPKKRDGKVVSISFSRK